MPNNPNRSSNGQAITRQFLGSTTMEFTVEKANNGYYFIAIKGKRVFNRDFILAEDCWAYIHNLTDIQITNIVVA
jgi:hypothetical protein